MTPPLPPARLFDVEGAPTFDKLAACVHCGLCLEACPTYRELRVEMDSPRGRLYLMKGILAGHLEPSEPVLHHLDQCLDCRACETACPAGVQYGHILERTRSLLQPGRRVGLITRIWRWFTFDLLLPSRSVQRWAFKLLWLLEATGLLRLSRWLGRQGWLPGRLGQAAAQAPLIPRSSFRQRHAKETVPGRGSLVFAARGERRARVALHAGCLADHLVPEVAEATIVALTENGCEVEVLPDERCCGALHLHNGALDGARALARDNVAAFSAIECDAVVSNAAGCSAELRRYGELLPDDRQAAAFAAKVRDVCELLVELGVRPPSATLPAPLRVAYADPCHLLHAQKISEAPRQLLRSIPGVTLVPLDDADTCCGSAGLYSVLQPTLSGVIADRKIAAIRESGADAVATGNPGCLLQIRNRAAAHGLAFEIVHPIELLARAYLGQPSASRRADGPLPYRSRSE